MSFSPTSQSPMSKKKLKKYQLQKKTDSPKSFFDPLKTKLKKKNYNSPKKNKTLNPLQKKVLDHKQKTLGPPIFLDPNQKIKY